ncbi:methyltransferase domain-containing protein [Actinacidiphila glaucinigra]|uniref:methyltransferase domain-containing protein n=1 Tax=Actinacidiphila glaucinigra TaxID=235986 RepID=UPI0035D58322
MEPPGVLVVQHLPHASPDAIGTTLQAAGLAVRVCRVWAGDPVPRSPAALAALVVWGGPPAAHEDLTRSHELPTSAAELALLRAALEAEVPVLGVGLGGQLLALAAGGATRPGPGGPGGCEEVRTTTAASEDPLFAGAPERFRVPHGHGVTLDLPAGAALLAGCDRHPVQAFRIGARAWGLQFQPDVDAAEADGAAALRAGLTTVPDRTAPVPGGRAVSTPCRGGILERFAGLAAARAFETTTRAFFTSRAADWERRFAADGPRYAAAVAAMELRPGQRVLDVGCGSGRALAALRTAVGGEGVVLGVDLTPAMLAAAVREGRGAVARLMLADACRLPLPAGSLDGVFSAGLVDHVRDPAAALHEWARVTVTGGVLLLFHPSGRAERAARHGRSLDPADPLAEENLRPALRAAGWDPAGYEDAAHHFMARAVRNG